MVTKGLIKTIDRTGNRCIVRLPLFETASSTMPVEIEALINITPGMYNNLFVNDVVFVAFEENALEKPIVIGKLYTGAVDENSTPGGAGILDTLIVRTSGQLPAATTRFIYEYNNSEPRSAKALTENSPYYNLQTPKNMADYIKWIERYVKKLFNALFDHFTCFKNWTQWQLRPENVEIDDGDIDTGYHIVEPLQYQEEGKECKICKNCTKDCTRRYLIPEVNLTYPD